MAGV
ncbi:23S rRNA (guanosine-2'-O-)-methyltransferase RlmB, partial [Yersinia pestis PY-60]|jgi:MFS family permease